MPAPVTFTPTLTGHVKVTVQASVSAPSANSGDKLGFLPLRDGSVVTALTLNDALVNRVLVGLDTVCLVTVMFFDQVTVSTAHTWGLRITDLAAGSPVDLSLAANSGYVMIEELLS